MSPRRAAGGPARRRVHTVILGGGPAGAATALALLRSGREVALVERTRYEGARVGETLPPEARRFLGALGVLEAFERERHVASPGIVSVWGGPEPSANDFIFNPYGHGWHLDRGRFDRWLAGVAEERGARLHLEATSAAAPPAAGARARIVVRAGARAFAYDCDHVVDAAGRAPLPFGPRRRRVPGDALAAIVGLGASARAFDGRTVLEAVEAGWWYCANLPDGRVVAALTTDPRLVGRDYRRLFREEARRTALVAGHLADVDGAALRVVRCPVDLRSPVVKDGWVAVGDAASAFDPLSSQGICKALEGGLRAGEALAAGALAAYEAWVRSSFEAHLRTRAAYYAMERRWPDALFWRARHDAGRAVAGT